MELKLHLKKRTTFGKKAKQLVDDGQVLGNLYGRGQDSIAVQGQYSDVNKIVNEAGHNIPINLELDGSEKHMALVHEVERDNITQRLHHVTFHVVHKGEKVETEVPIKFIGDAPATRNGLIVVTILDHLEVKAEPAAIPEFFEVNIESLVDETSSIAVKDIDYDAAAVEILNDPELLITKVDIPRAEVEEEPEDEEPADAADVPSEHGGDEDEESEDSSKDTAKED